ncbi:molybdenum cofactor guanylyltransferase MobA [Tatumella sp. JGM130]|uniref:molybdenum cofactor guanylyltransferase MobA n=1 Tax=Tatumella sp. JGM130 TaxID=2799797 RepID=UPI001BAF0F16|nr:molybdenum cofactor guanylyltransferase MobA [Tatumella sp. JGM130]MBS0893874.1 molybdenum cofactor guanylyltransferase MobA [Tatumella sp. JGM130]
MKDITGIILAGGAARRMAGKDKGLVTFREQPLFLHVAERFSPQVSSLMISANRHREIYQQYGYPCIHDSLEGFQGPLAGMLSGLEAAESDWVAFTPCDSPFIPRNFVDQLWQSKREAGACWIRSSQRDHPVFCLLHRQLIPALQDYLACGERRVLIFLSQYGHPVPMDTAESAFININTVQELSEYEAQP